MFNKLILAILAVSALFFTACDEEKEPTPQDCVIRDAEVVDEPCEGDDCPDCEDEDCEVVEEESTEEDPADVSSEEEEADAEEEEAVEEDPAPEEETVPEDDADEESEAGTEVLPG